jgi:cytochrome b pre-mRNA-processing protein 3
MLKGLFKPKPAQVAGGKLYAATAPQARLPALYADLGVPDTPEGRFELFSLHVYLILERLKGQGPRAAETAQVLFDTYASALDNALRELGVGDLSVGKRMRKLGEAFFGRVKSYEAAFGQLPDTADLEAVIGRTVYAEADASRAPALAGYVLKQRAHLAAQPLDGFLAGDVTWSAP